MTLTDLQRRLRAFVNERDWERFHTPKNLAMALAGEAGELLELFQWLTPEESQQVMSDSAKAKEIRHELADVLAYVLRLSDVLEIDLPSALAEKISINEGKYPTELAKGRSDKYNRL
jgi:dCTP diphosphatase